jgi:hypothetical protein
MSEQAHGAPEDAGPVPPSNGVDLPRPTQPSLTAQVRRRRADQAFFLRLRDAIQQNHRALERLGT